MACGSEQTTAPAERNLYRDVWVCRFPHADRRVVDGKEVPVNRIVYIVGAVVIIIALLSFFGLR